MLSLLIWTKVHTWSDFYCILSQNVYERYVYKNPNWFKRDIWTYLIFLNRLVKNNWELSVQFLDCM